MTLAFGDGGLPEFVDNPENRCPVVLLLDASASMRGAAIEELNAGVAAFREQILADETASLRVELCVIAFGGEVRLVRDFATVDDLIAPQLDAYGKTPMGGALDLGLKMLDARKRVYRRAGVHYYRPWMFLITDGAPTDGIAWQQAAMDAQAADLMGRLSFFTVGVRDADMSILSEIASPNRPPLMLQGLKFRDLFQWLSASVRRVSVSRVDAERVALPPVDGWAMVGV
ncbi:MAG: VWA domain-containing protein [Alphaproteobacteria bacterium]|nr:VWA domain-containing protein [Alphaproteobacteria bacterium]